MNNNRKFENQMDNTNTPGRDAIIFNDLNFEAAVREVLMKPKGAITKEEVSEIVELNISEKRISDISEIRFFTALEFLDLKGTQVSNLSPLKELKNLKRLHLIEYDENIERQITGLRANLQDCDIISFLDLGGIRITTDALVHILGDAKV